MLRLRGVEESRVFEGWRMKKKVYVSGSCSFADVRFYILSNKNSRSL